MSSTPLPYSARQVVVVVIANKKVTATQE